MLLKIINRKMETIYFNNSTLSYEVIPFEHNVQLDAGVYDRKKKGDFFDTICTDRVELVDEFDGTIYEYGKISNLGEDSFVVTPDYSNREKNKNGFTHYRGSNALDTRGYTHNLLSAVKAMTTIMKDDYFTHNVMSLPEEFTRLHTVSIAREFNPLNFNATELVKDKEKTLMVILLYSTFFIISNFTEEFPEETVEYTAMYKLLETLHRRNILEDEFIRKGFLTYLGMLSRSYAYTYVDGRFEKREVPHRRFHCDVKVEMRKYGNVYLSEISEKFDKYLKGLYEELRKHLGYNQEILTSSASLLNNQDYLNLRSCYIEPALENMISYQQSAKSTIEFLRNKEDIENGIESLLTIENKLAGLSPNVNLLEKESNIFMKEQICTYAYKLKRYLDLLKSDIKLGRFKLKGSMTSIGEPILDVTNCGEILNRGYLPFGYNLLEQYTDIDTLGVDFLNQLAQTGLSDVEKNYVAKMSSVIGYDELTTPALNELRRDDYRNHLNVSEVEVVNLATRDLIGLTSYILELEAKSGIYKLTQNKTDNDNLNQWIDMYENLISNPPAEYMGQIDYLKAYLNKLYTFKELISSPTELIKKTIRLHENKVQIKVDLEKLKLYQEFFSRFVTDDTDYFLLKQRYNVRINSCLGMLEDVVNNLSSYFIETFENRLVHLDEGNELEYRTVADYLNNPEGDFILDTKDLMKVGNLDMMNVLHDRIGSCMNQIENIKIKGKREIVYTDMYSEPNLVAYVKPTEITVDIITPYIEYYDIIHGNRIERKMQTEQQAKVNPTGKKIIAWGG